ncbi:polysaccharide biosynthesis/export family protein [Solimonas terrae]|uniref:Uncharacterized protein n=1 Tax=Solimonas terrae TaxID=1396819 RepID=A0A6M2BPI6_9GAMM|nr:polysaccharide biosynthesis/export family protein [Solimonas terrae]NGY04522.1 hypothetical protein [Solimonas terrae]
MFVKNSFRAAWLGALVSLCGCALVPGLRVSAGSSQPDGDIPYQVFDVTPALIASQKAAELAGPPPSGALPAADPTQPPLDYRIGPGDVLQIVVWDHIELTNPFGAVTRDPVTAGQLVSADGMVFFPYAGLVRAGGKTIEQVRSELTDRLRSVVTKPQVDVRVVAYRSGRIQVTGEVAQPGLVTLDDTTKGVLEAINERGGLNPAASRRDALLVRGGTTYTIDLAGLLSGARPAINPALEPGDIIHVPDTSNDQVFVLGEVTKQGPVVMGQQQMTLIEALTKTGGLDQLSANDSGVLVFRKPAEPNKPAEVFTLDLSQPAGLLLAGEFDLDARDVVYVKATKFAQYNLIIREILPTVTTVFQIDRLTN